jgi:hypothetical protein
MGAATGTPEAKAITEKLCKEFGLKLEAKGTKGVGGWSGSTKTPEQKEADLVASIEKLEPGTWLIVEHPGMDTDEMRAMGHKGYENVAADRVGVTYAFTSAKVKDAIKTKGVKLISHLDLPVEPGTGYVFSGKIAAVLQVSQFPDKVFVTTDVDARWVVEIDVDKIVEGTPPFAAGSHIAFAVHSPARTFHGASAGSDVRIRGTIEKSGDNIRHRIVLEGP